MLHSLLSLTTVALLASASAAVTGCAHDTASAAQSEDELRLLAVSAANVAAARASGDSVAIAKLLKTLASDRTELFTNNSTMRVARMRQLFGGMPVAQVRAVRAAYIAANHEDPEITLRSDALGETILRLSRAVELDMVGAINDTLFTETASTLAGMLDRADAGTLTAADRAAYFALLPSLGLWDAPVRAAAGDHALDSLERLLLARALGGRDLDSALRAIEAKLPAPAAATEAPRDRSVAVVASSHGAQWQELMGWATVMTARGYHLQVFTPEGRPVAFQRDSLSVSVKTVPLGFGCPLDLDPAGATGAVAAELLGRVLPAARFDATKFGAVYLAGGLGFNEDVAVAWPGVPTLTANANIAQLMAHAIDEKLPVVALCHGPTLLAATPIRVGDHTEALNAGLETASLPPFETYVQLTGRKEIQFTLDVNTHNVLRAAGGRPNVLADVANMSRVVKARKNDIDVITGPGPQAASNLAEPTMEAMRGRWGN